MLDVKYPGSWEIKAGKLYKGKQSMEEISEELDVLAGGNAITIFRGDTRVSTTVKQENGSRAVGTQCSNEIYTAVIGKGDTVNTEAEVVGVPYYTCYVPLHGSNGATVQAASVEELSASVMQIASQTKSNADNASMANLLLRRHPLNKVWLLSR